MNIVLVEEHAGGGREYSFDKGLVRFGRDAADCDIAFDSTQYPMVSRRHAEIAFRDGGWFLTDHNSSYGTYLNGQRVAKSVPIGQGSGIQFGVDGPLFRVIWAEGAASAPVGSASPPVPQAPAVQTPKPAVPTLPNDGVLNFADGRGNVAVGAKPVWLGREPGCDVIFDSSSATVSRRHAEISLNASEYVIADNGSFNGTLVNGQRISAPTPLYDGDKITLGMGGPVITFRSPTRPAAAGDSLAGQRSVPSFAVSLKPAESLAADSPKTVVISAGTSSPNVDNRGNADAPQLLFSVSFGEKTQLKVGRDASNDITLDGLQISKHHARFTRNASGSAVEDLGSTNGVFVNGSRITRSAVSPSDAVQIGTFVLKVDASGIIGVFDTRSKTRVDAIDLKRTVKDRFGGGRIALLDGISLSIAPNEFVGILGPSGAGKSTLMEAMNGVRPASSGNVMINGLDLYRHLDSLKSSIGYVPQDDIIHRELTVYRTLFYVAKLRLSRDVSSREIDQIVSEVLDVTGLSERRNVPVNQLSGGQRKRVSMAVELVTKPSVIFLDEPTSGLDPVTEETIMNLFRQIAESGRTVIMTTHAMENVRLFDKVILMMRGKLAFFGTPSEALKFLNATNFKDLFENLEKPVRDAAPTDAQTRRAATEKAAEFWKNKYLGTDEYKRYVQKPLAEVGAAAAGRSRKKRRLGIFGAIGQWFSLSRRYFEVLLKDKLNLFILFAQAPAIALLTFFVMGSSLSRDFAYFVLAIVAFWFGTSVSAREIVRERPIYKRERMVNLGILPYLASKLFVLGIIVSLQSILLFVPLKFFDLIGVMRMPGDLFGIPQLWTMLLTSGVGIAIGLFVSAMVRTSEMATSLVPLILIPQILFSGIVGVPGGVSRVISMVMPAAYSFDTMKRYSTLDTLEPEGANPRGKTKGEGLYRSIETENDNTVETFKNDLEEYKKAARAFQSDPMNNPTPIEPEMPTIQKIPDNLSGYVVFLHPWMNEVVNQIVLMLMFGMVVLVTIIVLRLQDHI